MSTTRTWFRRAPAAVLAMVLLGAGHAAAAVPSQAAVASAHPLATAAGHEILAAGGNAFDAAIAVAAVLAVVEPYAAGLGGGGAFLLHDTRGPGDVFVDAREAAPRAAVANLYENARGEVVRDWSINGPLAAGIPGLPAALVHLAAKYGQSPLAATLAPAIRHARDGFAIDERYRQMARARLEGLRRFVDTSQTFLLKGEVPPVGTVVRQPELAGVLERIARGGHDAFYRGELAERLVDEVGAAGGIWSPEDLAAYQVVERIPLSGSYRGARVVTAPPPSAGGVVLLSALQLLDALDYAAARGVVRDHLAIEALRRAGRDRALHLGDPGFVKIPLDDLLSAAYARRQVDTHQPRHAIASEVLGRTVAPPTQGESATHFAILDRQGNRVAATLGSQMLFGSAFTVPGTGILLNNAMDDFSAPPGRPNESGQFATGQNAIAPGKRPLSSVTPVFLEYNGRVAILGATGGGRIPGVVLQMALSLLDARTPQEALAPPRFHHPYLPDRVEVEPEYFGGAVARELRAMGHDVRSAGRPFGNAQVILWETAAGRVTAASDPRGSGQALVR